MGFNSFLDAFGFFIVNIHQSAIDSPAPQICIILPVCYVAVYNKGGAKLYFYCIVFWISYFRDSSSTSNIFGVHRNPVENIVPCPCMCQSGLACIVPSVLCRDIVHRKLYSPRSKPLSFNLFTVLIPLYRIQSTTLREVQMTCETVVSSNV